MRIKKYSLWQKLVVGGIWTAGVAAFSVLSNRVSPPPALISSSKIIGTAAEQADAKQLNGRSDALIPLPESAGVTVTEFFLAPSSEFQKIGALKVKLKRFDAHHGCYDISVQAKREALEKNGVRLNEPVKISAGSGTKSTELVVAAIMQDRVWGYVSEPLGQGAIARAAPPHTKQLQHRYLSWSQEKRR